MAKDTKTTAKTALTAKTTAKKSTTAKGANDFPTAYIRLRTLLDSLEMTTIRYCLKDTDVGKRIKRAKEIEAHLMPVIRILENKMLVLPGDCPDGYESCHNCCVPYPCP
jgi:hypothetical protein